MGFMERFFDLVLASVLLLLLSPLFLILMFLIKVDSAGPVFFTQKRIGKDNEEFLMFKFRTMRVDTPRDVPTHLFPNPQDYVTRVGKVLRKTSLDELPQLWNILKGEMTFIGPRPALYNQDDLIELRTKCGVHKLRPGVTGWAQVNGRDEISIEEKVFLDEYYYKNRSLNLDIKVIIKTLSNVVTSKNIKA